MLRSLKRAVAVLATFLTLSAGAPVYAETAADGPMVSAGADDGRFEVASVHLGARGPGHLSRILVLAAGGGVAVGDPTALSITSSIFTSPTDLTPASQYVNGYTGDLTIQGATPAGAAGAYAFGTQASPSLSFTNSWPGYVNGVFSSAAGSDTLYALWYLRQPFPNYTLPSEAANSGNAKVALTFSGPVYASDTPGTATSLSGLYVSGAVTSTAKSGIPVSNAANTRIYPPSVGAWVTEPGLRVGTGQGLTVEFFGAQGHGQGGKPLDSVTFIACDAGCAHSATRTATAQTNSARQVSVSCTGTNGSSTLTSCSPTDAFIVGMRLTVPSVPGEPRLLSKTANSLTLGSNETCATTLNSGDITVKGTPAAGDVLADGAFAGASITDANITAPAGVAAITSETVTADVTIVSAKATAAVVHTNATAVTANASHACVVNQNFQGSTGAVTVTAGDPRQVFSVTFTSGDFTGFTQGLGYVRAQAKPVRGDVVLDTQLGANGPGVDGVTSCDWFAINVSGTGGPGVCDSGSPAKFNVNGTDVTPNLHNLWFYLDLDNSYAPAYVWIDGVGGGSAAVQSTSADPGATKYFASPFAALTAAKAYNNNVGNRTTIHNDINGIVFCYVAGTYSGFGGRIDTSVTTQKPRAVITSVKAGGACPASGAANSDATNVLFTNNATANNMKPGPWTRVSSITFSGAGTVMEGADLQLPTTFPATPVILDGVINQGAGTATLFRFGAWWIYNSYINSSAADSDFFRPVSVTGAPALVLGTTAVCGTYTAANASFSLYNALGNVTWACTTAQVSDTSGASYIPQALSYAISGNKFMGQLSSVAFNAAIKNLLTSDNIVEMINDSGGVVPALQISGDNVNVPANNVIDVGNTIVGSRSNNTYLEGIPTGRTGNVFAVGGGGTFPAGTYYVQYVYANMATPTVESSTDGLGIAGALPTVVVALNGSISVTLPCDPNYVAYLYVGTTPTNGGTAGATLGNYATVAAADAKQLAMCQTVIVTGIGSAHTSPSQSGSTGHNEYKGPWFKMFDIDWSYNSKDDAYGAVVGQSGAFGSGGRIGSYENRFGAFWLGNVAVVGTAIGVGLGPTTALADAVDYKSNFGAANSWVKYKSDRSWGGSSTTSPGSPALNLGMGNYCLDTSVTNPLGLVPSGRAFNGVDIQGRARLNNGNGAAGAYERGCT